MADIEQDITPKLQAIADPTRRKILQALKEANKSAENKAGLSATDIQLRVKLSQPTISHHMAILRHAGLVSVKKDGLWRWYRRNESAVRTLLKQLKAEL